MIAADLKPWNSATTLYLARKLDALSAAAGRELRALDLGCGDGLVLQQLHGLGPRLYGCDLPRREEALRRRLTPLFPDEFADRVRLTPDGRVLPFPENFFDVVYANQVFEHVEDLAQTLAECARTLKPDGTLLALFPPKSYPLEGHCKVPFAHRLPAGRLRRAWLRPFFAARLRPRREGLSVAETVRWWDDYLAHHAFYRSLKEITALGGRHFAVGRTDTAEYIRAKADLLRTRKNVVRRAFGALLGIAAGPVGAFFVTRFFNGAFVWERPKKSEESAA